MKLRERTKQIRAKRLLPISAIDNRIGVGRWLSYVFFYAVLANVPFWAASRWTGIYRNGWLCLEYIAVGLLALFVPRIVTAAILFAVIAIDLLAGVCQTYYLSSTECLRSLGSLREFPAHRLVAIAAVVVLALLASAIAASLPIQEIKAPGRLRAAALLIGFALLCIGTDALIFAHRTRDFPNLWHLRAVPADMIDKDSYSNIRFSRLPTIRLAQGQVTRAKLLQRERTSSVSSFDLPSMPSATAQAFRASAMPLKRVSQDGSAQRNLNRLSLPQANGDQPNLALILVESWGLDSDPSVRAALIDAYSQPRIAARYRIQQGTVPFLGTTVAGEARELCGSSMAFHILAATSAELKDCLPQRLADLGYRSVALHGMDGHMFDRLDWYKTAGFHETWFADRFQRQGLPSCTGAFDGICDAAIAEWIQNRLEVRKPQPEFLYWVTLNSHLPVFVPAPVHNPASCQFAPLLAQVPAYCAWFQLVANVHGSVATIALSNLARPTIFVVVGDHAPPFSDNTLRSRFSSNVVPYLLLVPRQDRPLQPDSSTARSSRTAELSLAARAASPNGFHAFRQTPTRTP